MLKVMRDSFQHLKWILVFIIFMFVLLIFVNWGAGGATGRGTTEGFAARVNGDTISLNEFNRSLFLQEQRYEQMYGQRLDEQARKSLALPQRTLSSLIEERLLLQEADRMNLNATPAEVRRKILEIPDLNPGGNFVGAELYERYIKGNLGYPSAAAFEELLAKELTLSKIESAIANSIVISPKSAENEFRRRSENAKIRYIINSAERAAENVKLSRDEVSKFYNENLQRYLHGEQRHVKYLLADSARIQSQIKIDEPALRSIYETSKEQYKVGDSVRASHILIKVDPAKPEEDAPAKVRAEQLATSLRSGASFDALAKANSADPSSAAKGGDLGFFQRGQMVPEFESAAFSQPIGEIGVPVKTNYGYHIIKVTEKRPATVQPFEEVRAQLEMTAIDQRAKEQAREAITRVRAILGESKKTDEQFRAAANDQISYNDALWFDKGAMINGIGRNQPLVDWAFSSEVGAVGPVIGTSRGPVVPILLGTRPAGTTALDEVFATVERDAKQARGRELARAQLAAAMSSGKTIDATSSALGLVPVDASVTRDGFVSGLTGNNQGLIDAAMSGEVGETKGPIVVDSGAVAFQITERKKFDAKEFEEAKVSVMESMRQLEMRKLRAALLSRLRSRSDIETNPSLAGPPTAGQPRG